MPPYRLLVADGDRVRIPNGKLGTVTRHEVRWGHFMFVWVHPDKPASGWRKFLPVFNRRFVEEEIDQLTLLSTGSS